MRREISVEVDDADSTQRCLTLTRYFYPASERSDVRVEAQLQEAAGVLGRTLVRPLLPHQRDALLCLVSDVVAGLAAAPTGGPFEKSFLVQVLNKGMFQIAAAEFHVFCYVHGKIHTRLWEKRRAETHLFTTGRMLF